MGKRDEFLFWSKVEAAYGLETVITVITVIDSPPTSTTRTIWRRFGVVANVGIFAGIFPGLSPSLCIVATSKWPKPNRPLASTAQVVAGT